MSIFSQAKIGQVYRCRVAVERQQSKRIHLFPEWILGDGDSFHALAEEYRNPVYIRGFDVQAAWGNDIPLVVDAEVIGATNSTLFRDPITMAEREEIVYDAAAIDLTPIPCEFSISGRIVKQRENNWCDTFYWRDSMMKEWEFPRCNQEGTLLPFPLMFLRYQCGDSMSFFGPYHYTAYGEYVCMSPFLEGLPDACLIKCTSEEDVRCAGEYALGKSNTAPRGVSYIALTHQFQVMDEENRDILTALMPEIEALEQLLRLFPDINLNVQDTNGQTPLMRACRARSWDVVRFLLEHHANAYLKDSMGFTIREIVQQTPDNEEAVNLLSEYNIHVPLIPNREWGETPIAIQPRPRGHIHDLPYKEGNAYRNGEHIRLRCYNNLIGYRFTTNPPDGYNLNTSEHERIHNGIRMGRCACDIPRWKLDGFLKINPNAYWFIDTQIDGIRRTWRCHIKDLISGAIHALHDGTYKLYFDFKRGWAYTTPIIGIELPVPFEKTITD